MLLLLMMFCIKTEYVLFVSCYITIWHNTYTYTIFNMKCILISFIAKSSSFHLSLVVSISHFFFSILFGSVLCFHLFLLSPFSHSRLMFIVVVVFFCVIYSFIFDWLHIRTHITIIVFQRMYHCEAAVYTYTILL